MTDDETKRRFDDDQQSKAELLHNLQVRQIELEMQNRQLIESQQELEEARNRYADLYDFAPVGYLTLDRIGTVLEINLTGAAMLDMERLNIVGKPFMYRLVTSSVQPFLSHLRQTFANPGNSVTELQIKTREGMSRIVNLESLAMQGSKPTCRIMMTDVTEQRRMAVSLQLTRSAQDALLNAIPALVFYQDAELRYLNVSQAFADFVGRSPEDIAGKSVYDLFPREVAEDLNHISSSVLKTGEAIYGFESSIPDAQGTVFFMSTVLAAFRDSYGNPIGLVGMSNDISTYKSTANSVDELLLQNRKLTRNLYAAQEEERRRIAVELHDELGQWFTAIQAESQAICNIAKHDPSIQDSALAISKSASAVHEVIRGMLRHLRPTLLDELGLADSLRELQRQWCKSHTKVDCDIKLDVPIDGLGEELNLTVYRLIQEALNNVATHANASRVTINMVQELEKKSGSDFLVLRVEDDGVGFESGQVRAGIGLVGMRERVIALGGEFLIESTPGLGTKIMARLPLVGMKRYS